jgi:superfamily II DNA/RNA helicase
VVIGAETGSGKTLSYLLPLIDMTMTRTHQKVNESFDHKDIDVVDGSEDNIHVTYPSAVILLPNKDLCNQVLDVALRVLKEFSGDRRITIGEFSRLSASYSYLSLFFNSLA